MDPHRQQRQFVVHHCLGRGGYGEVYRATMVSPGGLRSDVAVKLLRVDVGSLDDAVRRLRDEGRMLGLLRHPGILRVHDLAVLDGRVGLVTEYVEGQDLSALFDPHDRIPVRCLVEAAAVVADVLDVAWSRASDNGRPMHLVHRDIKPSNIRVGVHGEVKVLDFGIARSASEQVDREARTGTGSTVGSLAYMAPERFTRAPAAPAADVFGLGCVLYEGLSGRRLFVDAVPVDMFRLAAEPVTYLAHLEEALAELPPSLDPELVDLVRRMLAHVAGQRPTASEVRLACDALAERLEGPPLRKWVRDREWPRAATIPGFLDGRTITEGTVSTEAFAVPIVDDRSSETFRMDLPAGHVPSDTATNPAVASAVASWRTGFALVLSLVAVALVAWFVWWGMRSPTPTPTPTPVPVPIPVPIPIPAPAPAPAPVPVPVPVPVSPSPEPAPTVTPRPVKPTPAVPAPEPVVEPVPVEPVPAEPVRFGVVRVEPASVRVELRGTDGVHAAGTVPSGSGYELYADFGQGMKPMGRYVDVVPELTVTVRCNVLRYTCDVDR
ncbi:MAG: serine/threonine protein kinase [Alphaproteobacteria bacterium]|nr:serine/threonine protein kinase [Alphaproteobacteria bacterium]MCB9699675.1 serine/threonine protein kinase [Alphaproteobacteria bacterium]